MEINQDRSGHFVVKRIEPQGPAANFKISLGDRILKVNGVQIDGLTMGEVVKLVRGEVRTKVTLQLQRPKHNRRVVITRMYVAPSNQVRASSAIEIPSIAN